MFAVYYSLLSQACALESTGMHFTIFGKILINIRSFVIHYFTSYPANGGSKLASKCFHNKSQGLVSCSLVYKVTLILSSAS